MKGRASADGGRIYDSFVVRIWRDAATREVQRVEVEHVQTAQIDQAAGVAPPWILERILTYLDEIGGLGNGDT